MSESQPPQRPSGPRPLALPLAGAATPPPLPAHPPGAHGDAARLGQPDLALALWMLGLTGIWGVNAVSVKVLTLSVGAVMGATLRNAVALALLVGWGLWRGERFAIRGPVRWHVLANGLLFAGEFIASYSGIRLSNAGHFSVFINTSPLLVAVGAHVLFAQDRLSTGKVLGLLGAFSGIVLLFSDGLFAQDLPGIWRGDLLILAAAAFWGCSTLHVKRFILGEVDAFRLLTAKLLVATPVMLAFSLWREAAPLAGFSTMSALMLAYQGGVVVFFSYRMYIVLLDRYRPSAVQSFVFLTPVWGVLSGIALLGEPVSAYLLGGMAAIGAGLFLINRPRAAASAAR